jgi:hypothetical protein
MFRQYADPQLNESDDGFRFCHFLAFCCAFQTMSRFKTTAKCIPLACFSLDNRVGFKYGPL